MCGIDRINSQKSYTISNCVSCCKTCNVMKLNFSVEDFLEKCITITFIKNGIFYKSENSLNKENMINLFKTIKLNKITDNTEFKYIHNNEHYNKLIWNDSNINLKNIKIELEFVNNNTELKDMWYYYRNTISSLPFQKESHLVGKQIYILVKDSITNKYLGIMSLSSDIQFLEDRDDFIGWTSEHIKKNKFEKINHLMNLSTCVPLQPFGFNFTGGKLLAKLAFSKEVIDHFKNKYKKDLLGITTTGIHGKSVQYERLKELKFVGYTKGYSVFKIPTVVINKCRAYLLDKGIKYKKKMHIVSKVLSDLGLNKNDYMMDNPKGIYFGFTHPQAKDYLCEKIDKLNDVKLKTSNEIFDEWLNKFALKRYSHLIATNRLNNEEIKLEKIATNKDHLEFYKEKLKNKEDNAKSKVQLKKEYFKQHYIEKKLEALKDIPIPTDRLILPKNFSIFMENESQILQFQKNIKDIRIVRKIKLISPDIQSELNRLVEKVKSDYKDIDIEIDTKIINPQFFTLVLKQIQQSDSDNNIPKPILPKNFSITTILNKDKIQFCKVIDNEKKQIQKLIKSDDLQKEYEDLVDHVNKLFTINITKEKIHNPLNWKTKNKF